ncbi:MAG: 2-hydroxyacid dehydrogenase [Thermoplasmata archaeon]
MISDRPRLLVALKSSEGLDAALAAAFPSVGYAYAQPTETVQWTEVEAMLVGSVERELDDFDRLSTPRLRFVQRVYTGLDGFPFERFPPPIQVAGNVGGFAPFVAEGAVALALASARSLVAAHAMVGQGRLRPTPPASTLRGKTALILGYGSIGREIGTRVAGLDMRVVGVNRTGRMAPGVSAMFPADRLDEALGEADVIFEARPLTRETQGSLGAAQFARMRPNAIFVNVGRAGTVVEEALYQHLKDHPEFRAALDVWWDEGFGDGRLGRRFPWTDLPNLTGSPHVSGSVPEAIPYSLSKALENLVRFFRGEAPLYLADPKDYESVDPAPAPGSAARSAAPRTEH